MLGAAFNVKTLPLLFVHEKRRLSSHDAAVRTSVGTWTRGQTDSEPNCLSARRRAVIFCTRSRMVCNFHGFFIWTDRCRPLVDLIWDVQTGRPPASSSFTHQPSRCTRTTIPLGPDPGHSLIPCICLALLFPRHQRRIKVNLFLLLCQNVLLVFAVIFQHDSGTACGQPPKGSAIADTWIQATDCILYWSAQVSASFQITLRLFSLILDCSRTTTAAPTVKWSTQRYDVV